MEMAMTMSLKRTLPLHSTMKEGVVLGLTKKKKKKRGGRSSLKKMELPRPTPKGIQ